MIGRNILGQNMLTKAILFNMKLPHSLFVLCAMLCGMYYYLKKKKGGGGHPFEIVLCFIFQMNTFSLKEEMGFSDSELRSLLLKAPKLWMKSK